ncbi:hypothetical protein DH2020_028698 [Rehmannia glutinosa]|uniref:Major facilitator superfamily (MFS) profile domain-containing protein n=1 Tax=Rehmannia glutinosa TaxID=99300 RepID=A0ABR0VQN1_REHGL
MPQFLEKFFPEVYKKEQNMVAGTNQYCKFDDAILTMFTSSLYLAALFASLIASYVTRWLGRKSSMLFGGSLFLTGAIINGCAHNVAMLIAGRILLGCGIGFANQSAPVYLSEMAPYKYRGALNMCFQLFITIGILAANLINYGTSQLKSGNGWRISLGCAAIPAVIFIFGSLCLPDTPNSLIERGKQDEALKRLREIRGIDDVEEEFNDLIAASVAAKEIKNPFSNLLRRKYRPHLTMVTLIPFFQQLTGMNVFMFYAPVLFKTIGFGNSASLMSAVITGIVNAVATLVSILTVDRFGRRDHRHHMHRFEIRSERQPRRTTQMVRNDSSDSHLLLRRRVRVVLGPARLASPQRNPSLEVRSAGQSINVCMNMIFTFFIAETFLKMLCKMKFGLFIFFSGFVFVMTIFIVKFLPETKGIPIEEMSGIWKEHPYWKKFVDDGDDGDVEITDQKKKIGDA